MKGVSGDTLIITHKGEYTIRSLTDKSIIVWNGCKWVPALVKHIANDIPVLLVEILVAYIYDDTKGEYEFKLEQLLCTPDYQFLVKSSDNIDRIVDTLRFTSGYSCIAASHLKRGMALPNWISAGKDIIESIVWGVYDISAKADVYSVDTSSIGTHTAILNYILTCTKNMTIR